jgi:hypothetical protein
MLIADIPASTPPTQPVGQVITSSVNIQSQKLDGVIGVCRDVSPGPVVSPSGAPYDLNPAAYASQLVEMKFNKKFKGAYIRAAQVNLLKAPQHGRVVKGDDGAAHRPDYHPESDFIGKDRATFLVDIAGYRVRVEYYIRVGLGSESCGDSIESLRWKISYIYIPQLPVTA